MRAIRPALLPDSLQYAQSWEAQLQVIQISTTNILDYCAAFLVSQHQGGSSCDVSSRALTLVLLPDIAIASSSEPLHAMFGYQTSGIFSPDPLQMATYLCRSNARSTADLKESTIGLDFALHEAK